MIHSAENISEIRETTPKATRRLFLFGSAATAVIAPLLVAQPARAEEWVYANFAPKQPGFYYPLRQVRADALSQDTLYKPGGSLDTMDKKSAELLGQTTHFREQGLELAAYYEENFFSKSDFWESPFAQAFSDSIGFCHGVVNVLAIEGRLPVDQTNAGVRVAQHSGDSKYQPGLAELTKDLATKGRPFAIESVTQRDGIWTNLVVAVSADGTELLVTSAGRGFKVVLAAYVNDKNVYYPVAKGQEQNFPKDKVNPPIEDSKALPLWTFNSDERVVEAAS